MAKCSLFFVLALFASSGCHALSVTAAGQLAELTTTNSDQETPLDTDGKRMRQVGDVTNEERFFSMSTVKEYWMKTFEEYCTMVGAIYTRLSSIILNWGPVKKLIEAGRESKVVEQLQHWVSQVLEKFDIKLGSHPGEKKVDDKFGSPAGEAKLRSSLWKAAKTLKIKRAAKPHALKSAADAYDEKVKAADALIPRTKSYRIDQQQDKALFMKLHANDIDVKHCIAALDKRSSDPYKKGYTYFAFINLFERYETYRQALSK